MKKIISFKRPQNFPAVDLQKLPEKYHWVFADSELLQSIFRGVAIQRGTAGTRLNLLVSFFVKFGLVYLVLFAVGALELVKLLLRQKNKSNLGAATASGELLHKCPDYFFVGFGAGSEESLFAAYCAEMGNCVARIDQTKVESMGQFHQVGLFSAFGSLLHSISMARQAMRSLPIEYEPWKNDFFTFIGMRLGYLSYSYAWFEKLKVGRPEIAEVCFLAADTAAFAAVNAGLPTRYLQHGLIRHSLLLPAFGKINALTHDEVLYFCQRLPEAKINLVRAKVSFITPRKPPCILVASVYGHHEELRRVLPFLEFASQQGVAIHVRPHPREDRSFWKKGNFSFPVLLEEDAESFDSALERLFPLLVVSWFSTALVDTLYRNIIPVSVSVRDDSNINDMVYPLFKHCLHWPTDRDVLQRIVFDDAAYKLMLDKLRSGMGQE